MYDQSTQDLTQGRYGLALQGFRDFVRRYPTAELADNAQYGVGECFFAQSQFDSAAVEYARVERGWPQGDRVPAALYKLALSRDRLGQADAAKKTFEDLVKRFPESGEAQLARERLGGARRR
jgi:tol-pal system protein YbgF